METPPVIGREHQDVPVQQLSISVFPAEKERIRKEALAAKVNVSKYVRDVLRAYWKQRDEEQVA